MAQKVHRLEALVDQLQDDKKSGNPPSVCFAGDPVVNDDAMEQLINRLVGFGFVRHGLSEGAPSEGVASVEP
eukprot:751825-Lingulodinium_polyedra.AAC.1